MTETAKKAVLSKYPRAFAVRTTNGRCETSWKIHLPFADISDDFKTEDAAWLDAARKLPLPVSSSPAELPGMPNYPMIAGYHRSEPPDDDRVYHKPYVLQEDVDPYIEALRGQLKAARDLVELVIKANSGKQITNVERYAAEDWLSRNQ